MARLQVVPSIFRSVMYDGCIEKGMCEEAGGTRYPQVNPIMTAGIDAANSLLAIKHLVFDTKKITMAQLMEAINTLNKAISDYLASSGATADAPADLSALIQNADFSDGLTGWMNDGLTGTAAWKSGTVNTGDVAGSVPGIWFVRGNTASDIKWVYQDVPISANGAYEFFATCAVHRSNWTETEGNNTNTYLYANKDSVYVITAGDGSGQMQVGDFGNFSVVSQVEDFNDPEECAEPGHIRIGLEKRSDIDGLQLNIIYFCNPRLFYYGPWPDYVEGIYDVEKVNTNFDVYNLSGMKVRSNATSLEGLPKGIYIVNGKKQVVD